MKTRASSADRELQLKEHPHRIELFGSPDRLEWPALCPNCGAPATERERIRKVFVRCGRRRAARTVFIRSVNIPFCSPCAARHRELLKQPTAAKALLRIVLNPAMIAFFCATAFAVITFPPDFKMPAQPQGWLEYLPFGFFSFAALWTLAHVWWATRTSRVPPPTEISEACDFSDNLARLSLRKRHVYSIRDPKFAEAFRAANRTRVVSDADREKARKMELVGSILLRGVLALLALFFGKK